MELTSRTLVMLEYVEGRGPSAKPVLTHKRLFAFKEWSDAAAAQRLLGCQAIAALEGTGPDRINLATINTIGPVHLVDEA